MKKSIVFMVLALLLLFSSPKVYAESFRCWNCHETSSRNTTRRCSDCGWNICPNCGACSGACSSSKVNYDDENVGELIGISIVGGFWFLLFVINAALKH